MGKSTEFPGANNAKTNQTEWQKGKAHWQKGVRVPGNNARVKSSHRTES